MKTLLLALFVSIAHCAFAQTDYATLEKKIEQVLYKSDAKLAAEIKTEIAEAQKTTPDDNSLKYLLGLSTFAETSIHYRNSDMKAVEACLEKASVELKKVKGSPWEGEAIGLRGMITGQLIGIRGGMSGMKLGPKSNALTSDALEDLPNSPRVLVFRSAILLSMPEMFGGSPKESVKLLTRAATSYDVPQNEKSPVHWGHAYAYAWLTQAKLKVNDLPGAKAAAEQALAIEPDYGWVRYSMLRQIEAKLAAKK